MRFIETLQTLRFLVLFGATSFGVLSSNFSLAGPAPYRGGSGLTPTEYLWPEGVLPGFYLSSGRRPAPPGMVLVPAGEFVQGGSPQAGYRLCLANNSHCKEEWFMDEAPPRRVFLDAFYLDTHEVTQQEFQKVMGRNPSEFTGDTLPVDSVTWYEARDYCAKIGKRLPTEAEWEKAARAGHSTLYPWGNVMQTGKANFCDKRCDERWNEEKFDDGYAHTAPVGSFPANALGLFDMTGNVYEWVSDWYGFDYYRKAPAENPTGPRTGSQKSMRGGSWINYSTGVRPADRTGSDPDKRFSFAGIRCARSL